MTTAPIPGPWFVGWKLEQRDSGPTKVPYISPTQRVNVWSPGPFLEYEAARTLAASDGFAGVGVVFSSSHDLVGVDIDGCRDPVTGVLEPWAQEIVTGLESATAPTPSGNGVRVWCHASKDPSGRRKRKWARPEWQAPAGVTKAPGVEVFLTGGFCTMPDAPLEGIARRPDAIAALLATAPAPSARVVIDDVPPRHTDLTVNELVDLIAVRHPKRYHKLFIAGPEDHRDDESALDRELAGYAAEVAGGDIERIEAVMRRSTLVREKWNRADYLPRTIRHALGTLKAEHPGDLAAVEPIRARTLEDIWRNPDALQPPTPVIPRMAWRGRVTVYSALDKAGKSTFVSAGCAAATRGQRFLDGAAAPPVSIVWCMLEEHVADLAIRAKALGIDPRFLVVFEQRPTIEELRAEVQARGAAAVVIDPLIRWAGDRVKYSGKSEDWRPVMDELRLVARDLDVAVIILHHATKAGDVRDSTEIPANADVILQQETRHDEEGVQRIKVRGRPTVPLHDFAVRFADGGYTLTGGSVTGGLSKNAEKALAALPVRPGSFSWTDWLKASGLAKSSLFSAKKELAAHIDVTESGLYMRAAF